MLHSNETGLRQCLIEARDVEEDDVPWRIEAEPVRAEASMARTIEVRSGEPEYAVGTEEPATGPQRRDGVMEVLDYVAQRDCVERTRVEWRLFDGPQLDPDPRRP